MPSQQILIYPDGRAVVMPEREPTRRSPERFWNNPSFRWAIGLFIATAISTFFVGQSRYNDGWGYMVPVMLILLAHEMGHYLTALWYHIPASPPFFIPMPFSPLGTFGALIVKNGSQEDRRQLFDVAIAGPIAGLVIAIPVCFYGAWHATPVPWNQLANNEIQFIAPPIVSWIVGLVRGEWPAGMVLESAILDAAWVGIFITGLNLIPIGQLDGGHILYCLIGKTAHRVANSLIVGTLVYMFLTNNYTFVVMLFLIFLMGPYHPPTTNDHVPLGRWRFLAGWLTLAFILVSFTPTPIIQVNLG